jgi:hypothetical protein
MGDYHGQMNAADFEKWVVKKLISHLSPQSVIVLHSAPCHCLQIEKPPLAYAIKADMISWPLKKDMNCNETMQKMSRVT